MTILKCFKTAQNLHIGVIGIRLSFPIFFFPVKSLEGPTIKSFFLI
jgi:hypothetical protein